MLVFTVFGNYVMNNHEDKKTLYNCQDSWGDKIASITAKYISKLTKLCSSNNIIHYTMHL